MTDQINPAHYRACGIEVIDVIEAYGLTYSLGNAVKYILRAGRKPGADAVTDLQKARWYVERAMANPGVWRTTRQKELHTDIGWFVPEGTPMVRQVITAFGISSRLGIGLSAVFGQVMYQGEVMSNALATLRLKINQEIEEIATTGHPAAMREVMTVAPEGTT